MPHRTPIQMRIDSDPVHLCVVRSAVETAASRFGLPSADCDKLVLAVDEAMTNVIRHGYGGRTDKSIWVTLSAVKRDGRSGVEVIIDDESGITDPSQIKPRVSEQLRPGGLGVSIIQQTVDEYDYQPRKDAAGLRLTLRKFAAGAGAVANGQPSGNEPRP